MAHLPNTIEISKDLGGISLSYLPTNDQLHCWHMVGYTHDTQGRSIILDQDNADLLQTLGGFEFAFCPLCGCRLE